MTEGFVPPSVVVGVDGSRVGLQAALWAIDEAIGRDLPLRLVVAAEGDVDAAEKAVNEAAAEVVRTGRAVTVATEVLEGNPTQVLIEASCRAAMVCVGAVGPRHFSHARFGSTAVGLAAAAHCPVAVVRGTPRPDGLVVVELDQSPDSAAVLQYAVEEARLRQAPLRALGTWQSADPNQESARLVHAHLDRRLEEWRHRYPALDVHPIAVEGGGLGYLVDNAGAIQLIIVGARNAAAVDELLGPALNDTHCSILVVDSQRLL
ncbi:MAG: universal stress protein [Mycobacterium sp.]|nr:universal stress protein [Mycobacterium sp.]